MSASATTSTRPPAGAAMAPSSKKADNYFNLEDSLVFYGSYHNNKINQLIHVIFVPCIVWSAFVILSYVNVEWLVGRELHLSSLLPPHLLSPSLLANPVVAYINQYLMLSAATALFAALSVFYLTLTFVPAATYDCFLFLLLVTAGHFYRAVPNAWQYALALHVFAWYMQIHPGHAIFEQRNAALTDNFIRGVSLGPLFAWYEILFNVFGWNKELQQRLQTRIDGEIAKYRAGLKKVQ